MPELPTALALMSLFVGYFTLLEVAKRKLHWSAEITRRLAHIGSGLCGLLDYLLVSQTTFLILMLLGIPFILISYRLRIFTSVHNVVRRTYGEIFLAIGVVAAFVISLLKPSVFIPALLIITFSDSLAGITSDILKQPRKIWLGSLVFFVITAAILAGFGYPINLALIGATVLALVERYSPLGSDNLTVPVSAAALLLLF